MTTAQKNGISADAAAARREQWVGRVRGLIEQVGAWARAWGWTVEESSTTLHERGLGEYSAPTARITLPPGDLPQRAVWITPIALDVEGGEGRVDFEGYPTLNRVRFVGHNGGWQIITDSNIPLRIQWDADAFRQLAEDLVS